MNLLHLTASTFFGGPERQMLGLARAMPDSVRTAFAAFPEGGRGAAFLRETRQYGFASVQLTHDFPKVFAAVREIAELIRETACDVLICHGYKAHILGRLAARRAGVPAIAVSRGWTGETQESEALRMARPPALAVHGSRGLRVGRASGKSAEVVPRAGQPHERDSQQRATRCIPEQQPQCA